MIQRSNPPAPLFDQPKTKAFFDPSRAQTQLECVAKVMEHEIGKHKHVHWDGATGRVIVQDPGA